MAIQNDAAASQAPQEAQQQGAKGGKGRKRGAKGKGRRGAKRCAQEAMDTGAAAANSVTQEVEMSAAPQIEVGIAGRPGQLLKRRRAIGAAAEEAVLRPRILVPAVSDP